MRFMVLLMFMSIVVSLPPKEAATLPPERMVSLPKVVRLPREVEDKINLALAMLPPIHKLDMLGVEPIDKECNGTYNLPIAKSVFIWFNQTLPDKALRRDLQYLIERMDDVEPEEPIGVIGKLSYIIDVLCCTIRHIIDGLRDRT